MIKDPLTTPVTGGADPPPSVWSQIKYAWNFIWAKTPKKN